MQRDLFPFLIKRIEANVCYQDTVSEKEEEEIEYIEGVFGRSLECNHTIYNSWDFLIYI